MSRTSSDNRKVAKHRERMRAAGLRPVQFWVPDTRTSKFIKTIRSQCKSLRNDSLETEVLQFTEAAAKEIEGWK